MVLLEVLRRQIFDRNHLKTVDDAPAVLVGVILSPELDALMDPRDRFPVLAPLGTTRLKPTVLPLDAGQGAFLPPKKARVRNRFASTEGGKRVQSHINADILRTRWQWCGVPLTGKGNIPLARGATRNRSRFGGPFQRAVQHHVDVADFAKLELGAAERGTIAILGVGEAGVAARATKPGIAGSGARLAAAEEGDEGFIEPVQHVL
jgi:hypothetical protein